MDKYPSITYTNDGKWQLLSDYTVKYISDSRISCKVESVTVPKGFRTNLASVPRIFWVFIAPFDLSLAAPIVHDYLYKNDGVIEVFTSAHGKLFSGKEKRFTQRKADQLFYSLMKREGVSWYRRIPAYLMVRLFARRWRLNKTWNVLRLLGIGGLIFLLVWIIR
jgi:hypothetical protein